ncbi:MAG: hypothetical protein U0L09_02330 [Christensenellales bacterium]|nr:hypothetical protein [Christensenellales bacterium]
MVLKINGVDILPFVAAKGIKWQRSDLDGENAGRTMDGIMHRSRVATKIRLDITCVSLRSEDARTILNLIYPEYVTVEYLDPMYGLVTKTMYSNNTPATYINTTTDKWEGISFPLIER